MAARTFNQGLGLFRSNLLRTTPRANGLSSTTLAHPMELPLPSLRTTETGFTKYSRFTSGWWKDVLIVGTVFSITGSCSMMIVQPTINSLGVPGSLKEGPWSYRAVHLTFSPISWCMTLVTIGSIFGKRAYFTGVATKVLGRFVTIGRIPMKLIGAQPKLTSKLV